MASIKFSAFTNEAVDAATTQLVGYKVGDTSANYRYSVAQLATALSSSIPTIYSADGNLAATRTVTHDGNDLIWDLGTNSQYFKTSSGSGTYLNFRLSGAQKGAIWNVSSGGAMYFRDSGGSDYFSVSTTGTMINTTVSIGAAAFATETLEVNGNCKITGQGYTEFYDTANTTLTVDWNNSNIQELTGLTGSHTFTASNPKAGATYILTLAQTGAVTATWTGVKWPGGTAPTLSGTGKTDVVTLICYDATGAGLYYGSATLDLA